MNISWTCENQMFGHLWKCVPCVVHYRVVVIAESKRIHLWGVNYEIHRECQEEINEIPISLEIGRKKLKICLAGLYRCTELVTRLQVSIKCLSTVSTSSSSLSSSPSSTSWSSSTSASLSSPSSTWMSSLSSPLHWWVGWNCTPAPPSHFPAWSQPNCPWGGCVWFLS